MYPGKIWVKVYKYVYVLYMTSDDRNKLTYTTDFYLCTNNLSDYPLKYPNLTYFFIYMCLFLFLKLFMKIPPFS